MCSICPCSEGLQVYSLLQYNYQSSVSITCQDKFVSTGSQQWRVLAASRDLILWQIHTESRIVIAIRDKIVTNGIFLEYCMTLQQIKVILCIVKYEDTFIHMRPRCGPKPHHSTLPLKWMVNVLGRADHHNVSYACVVCGWPHLLGWSPIALLNAAG